MLCRRDIGGSDATPNVGVLKRDAINFVSVFRDGSQKKSLSGYFFGPARQAVIKISRLISIAILKHRYSSSPLSFKISPVKG